MDTEVLLEFGKGIAVTVAKMAAYVAAFIGVVYIVTLFKVTANVAIPIVAVGLLGLMVLWTIISTTYESAKTKVQRKRNKV